MEESKSENLIELIPVLTDIVKHDIAAQSSGKEALCIHNMTGNNRNTTEYIRHELHALRYTNHDRNTSHVLSPMKCLIVRNLHLNKRRKRGRTGGKKQLDAKRANVI